MFSDFSLTLADDAISIIGPNGAGKTTLLKLILGVLKPQQGVIQTDGKNIRMCFQDNYLLKELSVYQNLDIILRPYVHTKIDRNKTILDYLTKFDLLEYMNFYPDSLSMGLKSKVSLIHALITKPDILLLDEPFASLDIYNRFQYIDFLKTLLKDTKCQMILVTHDIDEALLLTKKIVLLTDKPSNVLFIQNNDKIFDSIDESAFTEIKNSILKRVLCERETK